jgi:hypothetical protein
VAGGGLVDDGVVRWNMELCGGFKSLRSAKFHMGHAADRVRTTSIGALCGPRM